MSIVSELTTAFIVFIIRK